MRSNNRSRTRKSTLLVLAILVAMAVTSTVAAQEDAELKWGSRYELGLQVLVPWGRDVALQDDGGFALTLQMTAWENNLLGIGKANYPPVMPGDKDRGWLIFDDPDSCPSFVNIIWQAGAYESTHCFDPPLNTQWADCQPPDWGPSLTFACPADAPDRATWIAQFDDFPGWDFDETWVEFLSGTSVPFPIVFGEEETGPEVWGHIRVCDSEIPPNCWYELQPIAVGPTLGSEGDFTRYGRWDRLPGLVVIADHGPGLITHPIDPGFPPYDINNPPQPTPHGFLDPPYPLEAWNMAGHFQSIGHTLQANLNAWPGWGRTTLTAQLVAANDLFKPVGLVDRMITEPFTDDHGVLCGEGDAAYRLDGGPLTCVPGGINYLDGITREILVTLRIFVVNGDAPDIIFDMDGNGKLDVHDVEDMGHEALTHERTVKFYQFSEMYCGVGYDFDGNGEDGDCVAAARAGGITGVPR